jgi:Zn finger protein HypA/HybF involved in hydrogenase expression
MERIITKQMKFGAACTKCGAYFVAEKEQVRLCPWCERVESGHPGVELFEYPEDKDDGLTGI